MKLGEGWRGNYLRVDGWKGTSDAFAKAREVLICVHASLKIPQPLSLVKGGAKERGAKAGEVYICV